MATRWVYRPRYSRTCAGPPERGLGEDHPLGLAQGRQRPPEGGGVLEGLERAGEVEPAARERSLQLIEEQPPEHAGEHAHGEEESRPAPDPPLSVRGRSPARDHAVEVLRVQELGLAGLQPPRPGQGLALGTVAIAARVVGRARVPAGVTLLQVPAQSGGAAGCDRPHHPLLLLGAGVGRPVGGPVPAEHLRHFEPGPEHRSAAQTTGGGAGAGAGALGSGSRSKGLRVAHTVVVAIRR